MMFIKELNLSLNYEKYHLLPPAKLPTLTGYLLKNNDAFPKRQKRPAVIICPGGAYRHTSPREATPVVTSFLASGISAFVLHYSCMPSVFPTALFELFSTIEMVRKNAEEWEIDPDNIVVCGFSAGGHLAASSGVFWHQQIAKDLGFIEETHKPNGLVLCYPVISAFVGGTTTTIANVLGEANSPKMQKFLSLDTQVSAQTPPTFLWHTFADTAVSALGSVLFAKQLMELGIKTELHIYPNGKHGLSLSNKLVNPDENIVTKCQSWFPFAVEFIEELIEKY